LESVVNRGFTDERYRCYPIRNPFSQACPIPAVTRNKLHKLEDIVMITLCAVLGGYEDWVSIEDFGYGNEAWLRRFLELPNEIPSGSPRMTR